MPAGAPGPPPTQVELLTQLSGGDCVWLHGRRYEPSDAPRVIRHPQQNCRIAAARALGDADRRGPEVTAALIRAAADTRDLDTGDGWLMTRTRMIEALAAVADDPSAIPTLVQATREVWPPAAQAAARKARALGHDPGPHLDRAAAELPAPPAILQLAAFEDPRADPALIAWLEGDSDHRLLWQLVALRLDQPGVREAAARRCARALPEDPWRRQTCSRLGP